MIFMIGAFALYAQMPPVIDSKNIYSETTPGKFKPGVQRYPSRIYIPHTRDNTVWVYDPATKKIVEKFSVGTGKNVEPQHVVPSWDMTRIFATNDLNNTLAEIDPMTGKLMTIHNVADPYNMYYTPDGKDRKSVV